MLQSQLLLVSARLGVRPIEDAAIAVRALLLDGDLHNPTHDLIGLFSFVRGLDAVDELALPILGPEARLLPLCVVRDDGIGGFEDDARGPVVLLQAHDFGAAKIALEVEDVVHLCPPPAVNALVVIAYHTEVPLLAHE